MQTSLRRIANKARKDKRHRFQNLYRLLNEQFLEQVFYRLNKKAASGVDQVSYREYGANLQENIQRLVEKLKNKKYRARLVRRKNIPKGKAQLYARTSRKKLQSSVAELAEWCRRHRHLGNRKIFSLVNAKLRGHYNYFGVRCNFKSLQSYFREAMVILRKWLNRRSQRRSCSWEKFWNLLKVYRIERPRIVIKPIRSAQLLLPC